MDKIEEIPDVFFNPLTEKLKMYYIRRMPEAIISMLESQNIASTQDVLQNILNSYSLDFSKHVENKDIQKINYIWNSFTFSTCKRNKKFLYQTVKSGARARDYEDALQWLCKCRTCL